MSVLFNFILYQLSKLLGEEGGVLFKKEKEIYANSCHVSTHTKHLQSHFMLKKSSSVKGGLDI